VRSVTINSAPRNRDEEAQKARERSRARFATSPGL